MPDYGSFCPIALANSVVGDRWTPLILRELVIGSTRFNDIARGLPGISRSLLVQRLKHLERNGVIEAWPLHNGRGSEYHLTSAGKDLEPVLMALGRWAIEWRFDELRPHEVDAVTLMWWMHRRVDPTRFPPHRTVIEFRHTAPEAQTIWMVLDRGEASVCLQHPGFEPDVVATASTAAFADVFQGYRRWSEAVDAGRIDVAGTRRLASALPTWFRWSPWAEVTRERAERAASAASTSGRTGGSSASSATSYGR
jgi:DNA-binding HxlR family transcriptional regulator